MSLQGQCPSCGAPIEFGMANSLVTICDSCNTIAGRGDGKLENYGQVADLVETDSPLQVGLSGVVKDVPFVITGRAQLKHAAGGVWDEWYVAFRDGKRWGWLAEAQGKYYLTFPKDLPSGFEFDFESAPLESEITIPQNGKMKVVEIGQATAISAEGEIPYEFHPGETVTYADLQGSKGRFATLDNSQSPPAFYLGGEFSLERLGIDPNAVSREEEERTVGSVGISCPQCGGALEQHCPESLRIVCGYCDSMLDVSEGEGSLKFLEKLGKQKVKPVIPLGSTGELRGKKYTVIGFLRRKVRSGGVDYPWQEYLLYTPREGFEWLIHSESHWSLGKPVSGGDIRISGNTCRHDGKSYRIFARSQPVVTHVLGEFYWQVTKGERVSSVDYVCPPYMLSKEISSSGATSANNAVDGANAASALMGGPAVPNPSQPGVVDVNAPVNLGTPGTPPPVAPAPTGAVSREVTYTLGEYLKAEEVEQAFGVKGLRRPTGVAPNQPYAHKGIYPLAFMFLVAAMVMAMLFFVTGSRKVVYSTSVNLTPDKLTSGSGASSSSYVVFPDEKIKIRGGRNIQVTLDANVSNSWAYLAGDLINEETGITYPFGVESAYYSGPGWSEGSRRKKRYVSAIPSGDYTLRLDFQWDRFKQSQVSAKVTIRQGVPRILNLFLTLMALALFPIGIAFHHGAFEAMRWAESDFGSD